jgi:hypothetical protein
MKPILAKVTAIEKRGEQYLVIVQISPKYRGSFNTLAFGEIKPHSGSFKDGRLDLCTIKPPVSISEIRFRFGLSIDAERRGRECISFVSLPV